MTKTGAEGPTLVIDDGWARRSLRRSLSTAALIGSASAQVLMVVAALVAPVDGSVRAALVAAHVGVAVLALGVQSGRVRPVFFLLALDVTIVFGISTTDSVDSLHSFALVWMLNLSYSFPSFLLAQRGARVVSAIVLATVPLSIGVVQPDWRWALVVSTFGTGTAIAVAAGIAVRRLDSFAERVDDTVEESARQRGAAAAARASAFEGGERARILHDTVINTLGAVARGGGATRRVERVRERCRRDIPVVEALLAGHDLPRIITPLENEAAEHGVSLTRSGLDDAAIERLTVLVPDQVLAALVMASREAIVNVGRHAGTGEAELQVEDDGDALVVTVRDHGVGFDGRAVRGRGLAESLLARCRDAGIDVTVESEPGHGTSVEMRCPVLPNRSASVQGIEQADFESTVTGLRHRMALAWSAATVLVGIFIEMTNKPGQLPATYGMLATGALCWAIARWELRRRDTISKPVQIAFVLAVPPAFLFAAAGVDFARTDPIRWQAIGVTGPLVLLTLARSKAPFAVGSALLVLAAGGASFAVVDDSSTAAAIVLVGAAPALWVSASLLFFSEAVGSVGARAVEEQRASVQERADAAAARAAEGARERWRQAGLQACLRLLTDLASGRSDPGDVDVRVACADEERHLRSLILLNPALTQMGFWLARSLTLARAKGVSLVVRTGDLDVDESAASRFGLLLQDVVDAIPPGSELTLSLFSIDGAARLAVVGPGPYVADTAREWVSPNGWHADIDTHVGLDIVEVVESRPTAELETFPQEVMA